MADHSEFLSPASSLAVPSGSSIDVIVKDKRWTEALPDLGILAEQAALFALDAGWLRPRHGERRISELALLFADDNLVHELNIRYRDKDKPTNVLSFPGQVWEEGSSRTYTTGPFLLGDVVLAYDCVAREAEEQNKPLASHARHLIVHGILHLLGYDHSADDDAVKMEQLETMILHSLGDPDPYGRESGPMR